ncbi:hypothetical protein ES705_44052 [subsurface metagenome]
MITTAIINLAQYIARPPISLKKIILEDYHGKVLFHKSYNEYFKLKNHYANISQTFCMSLVYFLHAYFFKLSAIFLKTGKAGLRG